jgi:hypothetical protein
VKSEIDVKMIDGSVHAIAYVGRPKGCVGLKQT